MKTLLTHCRLISPSVELDQAAIEIEDGIIKAVHPAGVVLPEDCDSVFDVRGQMVMPGFIDIHIHGAAGFDFTQGTLEAVETITEAKLKEGVTTLLPTTLSTSPEKLTAAATAVAAYAENPRFTKTPGLHLEGPYLSPKQLGAMNPSEIRLPDLDEVCALHAIMPVTLVSLAIEIDGALEMIRELIAMGIAPSAAHSAATAVDYRAAKAEGLRHVTHFCNQMSGLHHREIGLVGSGLMDEEAMLELICDKIHLCPDMIQLIFKIKETDNLMLITDSVLASWMDDGEYTLSGFTIQVKDGVARLTSNGALAGSTIRLNQALKNVYELTGLPLSTLVKTTAWNQAQSLGLPNLGKIEPGFAADLVVLNNDFIPTEVFVDGEPRLSHE